MLQRGQDGLVSEVLGSRSCLGLPFTSCVTLSNLGNLFFLFYLCIYLFLATLGLCCCSQALASCSKWGINFPVAVRGPLIAGASRCRAQAPECSLSSCGAWASYPRAYRIFPDQGSNPGPLHWQVNS